MSRRAGAACGDGARRLRAALLSAWGLIALALGGAAAAQARDVPAESAAAVLAAHCRAREALSTLRTRFVQVRVFTAIGDEERSSGVFYYRKPDAFRWEYAEPDASFTVVNGRQGWAVFPGVKQARRLDLAQASVESILSVVGFGPCGAAFAESFESAVVARSRHAVVVSMRPVRPEIAAQFTAIVLTLDPGDHLPRAVVLDEPSGNQIRLEFMELRRDARLDAALFRYAPPEDYDVMN